TLERAAIRRFNRLTSAKKRAAEALKKRGILKGGISRASVDNIWKKYKPVSHLWAARWSYVFQYGHRGFPCEASDLGSFLAVSEIYCREGIAHRYHLAPAPTLKAEEMWRVPPEIALPEIALGEPGEVS